MKNPKTTSSSTIGYLVLSDRHAPVAAGRARRSVVSARSAPVADARRAGRCGLRRAAGAAPPVRRYVTVLQDLGIPVESERGRYGAYRLRPGFKLPPLMFSDQEALAVVLGLLAARRLGLAVAGPAVEGALAKIERVLPA